MYNQFFRARGKRYLAYGFAMAAIGVGTVAIIVIIVLAVEASKTAQLYNHQYATRN